MTLFSAHSIVFFPPPPLLAQCLPLSLLRSHSLTLTREQASLRSDLNSSTSQKNGVEKRQQKNALPSPN